MAIPTQSELLESVLEAYESEYKDLLESWRVLETKAQALSTTAGVFIAAAFAFARDLAPGVGLPLKAGLTCAVVLLLLATSLGVAALVIRAVRDPLGGSGILELVDDLVRVSTPEDAELRYCNYLRDRAGAWESSLTTFRAANRAKSRRIAVGQVCLLCAASFVAGLVVRSILSR